MAIGRLDQDKISRIPHYVTRPILTVPGNLIIPYPIVLIHQFRHFFSHDIKDSDLHLARIVHPKVDEQGLGGGVKEVSA